MKQESSSIQRFLCHDTVQPACGANLDDITLPKVMGSSEIKGTEIYHSNQMLGHETRMQGS